eukprot:TRINITY_DN70306_c0_g1_i1.p1 TRINITY_DN70306_c0_g1~~TRINITY_DN70306_c0_g1_i1.p1  ORF type:complete len:284 (+),score=4.34 TRINITY_DN70306_c0_g1_i1:41-892(+)
MGWADTSNEVITTCRMPALYGFIPSKAYTNLSLRTALRLALYPLERSSNVGQMSSTFVYGFSDMRFARLPQLVALTYAYCTDMLVNFFLFKYMDATHKIPNSLPMLVVHRVVTYPLSTLTVSTLLNADAKSTGNKTESAISRLTLWSQLQQMPSVWTGLLPQLLADLLGLGVDYLVNQPNWLSTITALCLDITIFPLVVMRKRMIAQAQRNSRKVGMTYKGSGGSWSPASWWNAFVGFLKNELEGVRECAEGIQTSQVGLWLAFSGIGTHLLRQFLDSEHFEP